MRYIPAISGLSAPSFLIAAAILLDTAIAIDPKHHAFLKRQGCSDVQSQCSTVGASPTKCINYICSSCTNVLPAVSQCCKLTGNTNIATCIEDNIRSSTSTADTSIDANVDSAATSLAFDSAATSGTASSGDFPITTGGNFPTATSGASPSVYSILTFPGCSSLESKIQECQSATPNILGGSWSTQASCFCYSESSFQPSSFDNYYGSCLGYLATANPDAYDSVRIGDGKAISTPCASIGDVQAITTSRGSNNNNNNNNVGGGTKTTASPGNTPTSTRSNTTPTSTRNNTTPTASSAGGSSAAAQSGKSSGQQKLGVSLFSHHNPRVRHIH